MVAKSDPVLTINRAGLRKGAATNRVGLSEPKAANIEYEYRQPTQKRPFADDGRKHELQGHSQLGWQITRRKRKAFVCKALHGLGSRELPLRSSGGQINVVERSRCGVLLDVPSGGNAWVGSSAADGLRRKRMGRVGGGGELLHCQRLRRCRLRVVLRVHLLLRGVHARGIGRAGRHHGLRHAHAGRAWRHHDGRAARAARRHRHALRHVHAHAHAAHGRQHDHGGLRAADNAARVRVVGHAVRGHAPQEDGHHQQRCVEDDGHSAHAGAAGGRVGRDDADGFHVDDELAEAGARDDHAQQGQKERHQGEGEDEAVTGEAGAAAVRGARQRGGGVVGEDHPHDEGEQREEGREEAEGDARGEAAVTQAGSEAVEDCTGKKGQGEGEGERQAGGARMP